MIISIYDIRYQCSKAIKGSDYVILKNAMPLDIDASIENITPGDITFSGISDFSGYVIEEGSWSLPEPTEVELLKAQLELTEEALDALIMGGV